MLDVDMLLEPGLNEVYLFHGTTREVADIITHHGFDERVGTFRASMVRGCTLRTSHARRRSMPRTAA